MIAPTPGPWRVCDDTDIVDARGRYVATTHDHGGAVGTLREYNAAKFIVRACNSHDALLAALEACRRALSASPDSLTAEMLEADRQAAGAIKLARGEQ